ncbi:hypothetical protein [Mycolicibacterium arseniciresistens]|uniref:Uncharacterized protein n=1 Tax=Mycolicibacterium arseniciresistens TaxID=3062257 RepID=A0ABT8UKR0_9MYCO|nr:hypothetical protein [Mycolicibacterium arseniciresistens]MDO3637632.1 hypothetical protein [Mycolicibacterium arseniciresistens]
MPRADESEDSQERRAWVALHREREERRRREEAMWDKVHASATADLPQDDEDDEDDEDEDEIPEQIICDLPTGPEFEFDSDEEF